MNHDAAPKLAPAPASAFMLSELMIRLFTPEESRRFLGKYYQEILFAVPHDSVPQTYFDGLSLLLFRHGVVDLPFFQNLQEERPRQYEAIYAVALAVLAPFTGRKKGLLQKDHNIEISFSGSLEDFDMEHAQRLLDSFRGTPGGSMTLILRVRKGSVKVTFYVPISGSEISEFCFRVHGKLGVENYALMSIPDEDEINEQRRLSLAILGLLQEAEDQESTYKEGKEIA